MAHIKTRRSFYEYSRDPQDSIEKVVQERTKKRFNLLNQAFFDERNAHSYRHGKRWTLEATGENPAEFLSTITETKIYSDDIVNHDVSILEKQVAEASDQLHAEMTKHLFRTVHESTEATGNTINATEYENDFSKAFVAMIEKIEFGVDRYGRASKPTMFIHPSQREKTLKTLQDQPNEYQIKIEELLEEKEKQAIAREAERIAKFRWSRT